MADLRGKTLLGGLFNLWIHRDGVEVFHQEVKNRVTIEGIRAMLQTGIGSASVSGSDWKVGIFRVRTFEQGELFLANLQWSDIASGGPDAASRVGIPNFEFATGDGLEPASFGAASGGVIVMDQTVFPTYVGTQSFQVMGLFITNADNSDVSSACLFCTAGTSPVATSVTSGDVLTVDYQLTTSPTSF